MEQASMLDANNRSMLASTMVSIAQIDSMIEGYIAQDEVAAERQKVIIQQLKEINDQRENIKDTIAAAQVSRRALELATESLKGLFSPIRRLPVEILFHIFYALLVGEEKKRRTRMQRWSGSGVTRTPFVLGRVCSQWRNIVNQTPKLWETILVESVSFRSEGQEYKEEIARLRIAQYRSQGIQSKQSLFLDTWDECGNETMLSLVGSHKTPWKSIEIAVGYDAEEKWKIQHLRATEVILYRCTHLRSLECFMPLMRAASSLTITGMPPSWGLESWSSLVSLEIRPWVPRSGEVAELLGFNSAKLSQLLNAAPNLEVLSLFFAAADESQHTREEAVQPIAHAAIKELSLHLHHLEPNLAPFGVHIASSLLCKLSILSFDRYCPFESSTSAVWNHLTSLSLGKIDGNHLTRVLHLLCRLPTVKTLELQGSHVNRLFSIVIPSPQGTPQQTAEQSLPRLIKLILHETDIQGGTLIGMLSGRLARLEGGEHSLRALESVDLYDNAGVLPQDWKRVQDLLEAGRLRNASRVGGVARG